MSLHSLRDAGHDSRLSLEIRQHLGYIHLDSDEKQEAGAYFEQALALAQSIGLKTGIQEAAEALQE